MKRISFLLIMLFILICLTSCKKEEYKKYNIGQEKEFINQIYDYIDNNKEYCLIDVRDLETEYSTGHFKGFINYSIEKGNTSEFVYKIKSMYSKEKAIFIIDKDGSKVEELMAALKEEGYPKIYIYLGGYGNLEKNNNDDFIVVTGTDDCGC